MSQHHGRAMNRAARRRAARQTPRPGMSAQRRSHDEDRPGEPRFLTINTGPDYQNASCGVITETTVNPRTDTVTVSSVALEDTVHPVGLNFDPPYVGFAAVGGAKGFQPMWENMFGFLTSMSALAHLYFGSRS